jgi:hypothetical protein
LKAHVPINVAVKENIKRLAKFNVSFRIKVTIKLDSFYLCFLSASCPEPFNKVVTNDA